MRCAVLLVGAGGCAAAQTSLQQALLQQGGPGQAVRQSSSRAAVSGANLTSVGPTDPPATVETALRQMADQAAVVFAGSVVRVTELGESGAAEVEFAIEEGFRGVPSQGTYRTRVSAWAGGADRYHPGERALFLLHAPSALGFSSPVGGERGIVPLAGDAVAGTVDLRWIATGVFRSIAVRQDKAAVRSAAVPPAAVPVPFAAGSGAIAQADGAAQLAMSNVTGQDVHAIDRGLVTDMLRTWNAPAGQSR